MKDASTPPPLVVLLGPTAVGKTALSLALCRRFGGEVVNADSRQIYRGMAIGTAKPTPQQRLQVPHHLLDLRAVDEVLSVAEYQQLAYAAIVQIHQRQRVPFLVGGTVLYVRAVVEGLRIPDVAPNPTLRAQLEALAQAEGAAALFARLQALDPHGAARTDPHNVRRLVRALEIFLTTGRSKTELEGREPPPYRILQIGLRRQRDDLYCRIDARVDAMMAAGLLAESRQLLEAGYAATLPALTSLGYRQMVAYLQGEVELAAAVAKIKTETHRYVRHQESWFRRLSAVTWYDLSCSPAAGEETAVDRIGAAVAAFLRDD